jgi:hypothetical protein
MSQTEAEVRFEEQGSELTAIEIVRSGRRPVIVQLYRVLLGLGIVVSSYQARPGASSLAERMVLQREEGGALGVELSERTKAAVLPVVLEASLES